MSHRKGSIVTTRQQQETLDYFRAHAEDWRSKAEGSGPPEVNIIEQRNSFVLRVAGARPATRAFLDVGCGTGELVCQVARRGIASFGVDYAPEMISLATQKARTDGVEGAEFTCCSIFDFHMASGAYDLISANGFIEYVSLPQMLALFDRVAEALAPGGSFVVGSRNRLFNLVSMNQFTVQELESGGMELLMNEAVKWSEAKSPAVVVGTPCAPLQADQTEHARTGIDVATRFQYTPLQLIGVLHERGLHPVEVYPVHIHGVTPTFKAAHPEVHNSIANLLQAFAGPTTELLSHASTFMLHVQRSS